jgi:hippurate hydrolase
MAEAAGLLHNASISVEIQKGYPPVVNSKAEALVARGAACKVLGDSGVAAMQHPSMGSEDFSYYLNEIPGCFVRFGARHPDWEPVPLHSPGFDIDERVLSIGARFFEQVARDSLDTQGARDD